MRLNKILWATDGSEESRDALRWAEMLAKDFGAKLITISVIEAREISRFEAADKPIEEMSLVEQGLLNKKSNRIRGLAQKLTEKGIEVETRVIKGIPDEEIIKAAQTESVDLIVMGKRGLNVWDKMLLGSTVARVLREVSVPVLTVRKSKKKPAVKKIVVPTSFSPVDIVPLEWALDLAKIFGSTVYLLHIIEAHKSWDTARGGFMGRRRKRDLEQLEELLARIATHKRNNITVRTRVKAFPRPWSGIVSFVRDEAIDMVIMGTHARKGVPKLFLGSVAERVIAEAPCPVITVRP
jgi:nucleotide-binding universal stress UspA family protein